MNEQQIRNQARADLGQLFKEATGKSPIEYSFAETIFKECPVEVLEGVGAKARKLIEEYPFLIKSIDRHSKIEWKNQVSHKLCRHPICLLIYVIASEYVCADEWCKLPYVNGDDVNFAYTDLGISMRDPYYD